MKGFEFFPLLDVAQGKVCLLASSPDPPGTQARAVEYSAFQSDLKPV